MRSDLPVSLARLGRQARLVRWSRPRKSPMKRCWPLLVVLITSHALASPLPDQQPMRQTTVPEGEGKISDRLRNALASRLPGESMKVWVYLADKGIQDEGEISAALKAAEDRLTPRSRRRLSTRSDRLTGWEDIPVHAPYLNSIVALGGRIHQVSRWINAVSVSIAPADIQRLADQSFVLKIETVNRLRRPAPIPPQQPGQAETGFRLRTVRATRLDYGPSYIQVNQLHVPELHDLGLSGHGVQVALFDTGFKLDHVAFDSLRTRVVGERDFIQDELGFGEIEFHEHGTQVLSTIGGYAPGQLIGPAYGARYLLANTESVPFETDIEEDWWLAAMEWADSLGADVISSSLVYSDWYTYSDMDGETAVVTRAAATAARRGIVVVNAMGNLGGFTYEKMGAPADAEEVVSVGAVDAAGRRTAFSSIGPTFDGRIKPDVMAMGEGVYTVDPLSMDDYLRSDGTSFSAPLVAGVAALLLEAYPHWTPERVQRALRSTATQAAAPDTLNGYGIVHALDALLTESRGTVGNLTAESGPSGVFLSWTAGLEINLLSYQIERRDYPDGSYELLSSIPVTRTGGNNEDSKSYSYTDTAVQPGSSYEYRLQPVGREGFLLSAEPVTSRITYDPGATAVPAATLYTNAPNPFAASTHLRYELTESSRVTLTIYNLLGRKVRVLVDADQAPGRYSRIWNGTDGAGRTVPSGVYFYRLKAGAFEEGGKLLLLR